MKKLLLALAMSALLAASAASSASATPFSVKTEPASQIGAYRAQLNGAYYAQAEESGVYAFAYGTTTSYGFETPEVSFPAGWPKWTSASQKIEGLQPETTYHFIFGVRGGGEVSAGEDRTFTTKSVPRFEAAEYYADVTGKQLAGAPVVLAVESGDLRCNEVGATGRMQAATSSLKLTPVFSECIFLGLYNATVSLNGCQYVLHPGDSGGPTATMDVTCPEGSAIEVSAGTCKISIPAQTGLASATTTETVTTPTQINAAFNVSGLSYTKTKDGLACRLNGTGPRTDGSLSGTQTLSAVNSNGTPIALKIGY